MYKIRNFIIKRKNVLNVFILAGGLTAMIARDAFCFFVFHQPKFPDALGDIE